MSVDQLFYIPVHPEAYYLPMNAQGILLTTPSELSAILHAESSFAPELPRTRVLDVRWSLAEPNGYPSYLAGHIPGAAFVDLEAELSAHGEPTDGRHPLPTAADLTAAARRWGLNPGDRVVVYDGGGNLSSARAWWLLRDAGIADVRLLDGALPAWIAEGLPLESSTPEIPTGSITLSSGLLPRLALDDVAQYAREHLVLDVRAAERYAGESEPIDPRAGHVPSARNLPTPGNLDADGRFLDSAALRERFAAAGADGFAPIGVYCGSGITASHTLFALALAGLEGTLFPGSWSQWSNHHELPVATGHEPG